MDIDKKKRLMDDLDLEDLQDAEVGDIYEIGSELFKVVTVKPVNVHKNKFAVELSDDAGYTWKFFPVKIYNWAPPTTKYFESKRIRKNKNRERDTEIYHKSFTTSSKELANEYGLSYAMIRYVIKKMKKELGDSVEV